MRNCSNTCILKELDAILTSSDIQRLIGRKFLSESDQSDIKRWQFDVFSDDGTPKIQVDFQGEKKLFHPEEISAMILAKMKETAEAYLGKVTSLAV